MGYQGTHTTIKSIGFGISKLCCDEQQTDIHTYIHTYRQTYRHTYRHTDIQTDRRTDRQTVWLTGALSFVLTGKALHFVITFFGLQSTDLVWVEHTVKKWVGQGRAGVGGAGEGRTE